MQQEEKERRQIPGWLLLEEDYIPVTERDSFLEKTMRAILSVLAKMKAEKEYIGKSKTAPSLRIAGAVFVIVLLSLSRNLAFAGLVFVLLFVRLAFCNGRQIKSVLKGAIGAVFFSAVILAPAAILGHPHTFVYITLKVFLSVTLLGVLSNTIPWNEITSGLKSFHLPDIFIFTLDLTMHYIMQLGEICYQMLFALRTRTIGKSPKKAGALTGILGVTFLKSKELSQETYDAMVCRGFDGTYPLRKRKTSPAANICYGIGLLLTAVLFFYLEHV